MNQPSSSDMRILAVDPCGRGFGFAVMEGLEFLVDWGMKEARANKNETCIKNLGMLVAAYLPDRLVIEDWTATRQNRCQRLKQLLRRVFNLALRCEVPLVYVRSSDVRRTFEAWHASNKHEIATVIGNLYPELIPRIPPKRKSWMSEDPRTSIFDAVALGITYFYSKNKHGKAA